MRCFFLFFVLIFFTGVFFSSCGVRREYIPVESIKTEYRDKWLRDSIFVKDSVLIRSKNDTVWMEKYRYLFRDKFVRDSIFITDSIRVPFPVMGDTVYVNRLYAWQYFLMVLGAACIGMLLYRLYRFFK